MSSRLVLRLIGPTLAVSMLLLVLGGTAGWYVHHMESDSWTLMAVNVAKVRAAEELAIISHELRNYLDEFLITGDPAQLDEAAKLRQSADRWVGEAEQLADSPQEQELIVQIRQGYDRYFSELDHIVAGDPPQNQRQAAISLIHDVTTDKILRPIYAYRKLNQTTMDRISERNALIADRMGLSLLLLGCCGAVAGLLSGFAIARGIQRSIIQLQVPIHDAAGKLNEVVGPIVVSSDQDIRGVDAALKNMATRVGEVVETLQESQRAALRAEHMAAVGQLAAGLAHELRNPLTSMRVLIQSAKEEGNSARLAGRDLDVVDEEIIRLDRSIQAFLDYARPPTPEKRSLDLVEVVKQTTRLVSGRATNQGVRIQCDFPPQPVPVEADFCQMRQIFLNLLLNAMESAPADGIIRVRMREETVGPEAEPSEDSSGHGHWLVVQVSDSGSGLTPDVKERIFEPFFSTKDTGTGLGLPICKRIIEAFPGDQLRGDSGIAAGKRAFRPRAGGLHGSGAAADRQVRAGQRGDHLSR